MPDTNFRMIALTVFPLGMTTNRLKILCHRIFSWNYVKGFGTIVYVNLTNQVRQLCLYVYTI